MARKAAQNAASGAIAVNVGDFISGRLLLCYRAAALPLSLDNRAFPVFFAASKRDNIAARQRDMGRALSR
jgi:hypothetical protein